MSLPGFSVVPFLLRNEDVPARARAALRDALAAPPEVRAPLLRQAAGILHREVAIDCRDALELVGLSTASLSHPDGRASDCH